MSGWSGNASVRRAVPDPGAQHLRRRPYSRWPREAQPTHSRNDGCAAPRFFSARRFGLSCDAARRGVGGSETREPTRQFSNDDLTSRIVVSPWLSCLVVDKIRSLSYLIYRIYPFDALCTLSTSPGAVPPEFRKTAIS